MVADLQLPQAGASTEASTEASTGASTGILSEIKTACPPSSIVVQEHPPIGGPSATDYTQGVGDGLQTIHVQDPSKINQSKPIGANYHNALFAWANEGDNLGAKALKALAVFIIILGEIADFDKVSGKTKEVAAEILSEHPASKAIFEELKNNNPYDNLDQLLSKFSKITLENVEALKKQSDGGVHIAG